VSNSDNNQSENNGDSFEEFFDATGAKGTKTESVRTGPVKAGPSPTPPLSIQEELAFDANESAFSAQDKAFDALVTRCKEIISNLPFQGRDGYELMKKEIARSKINFESDASLQELSRQIGVVQVMKDSLVAISAEAHSNWTARRRISDILFDAFMAVSQQKTADKRKGDANLKLADFSLAAAESEAFYNYCKQIVENLESQHKTASRRIACAQMQIAIGELSSGNVDLGIPDRKEALGIIKDAKNSDFSEESTGEVGWGEVN
jgi:hypothetical protein